jgi:prepilin-type processing-associated H-X9-DG protein
MSNLKQMQLCWSLYTLDNEGRIPLNFLGSQLAWISGDVNSVTGATNVQNIKNGKLWTYNTEVGIYQCAAAKTLPAGLKGTPSLKGKQLVRHYSMQGRMGGSNGADGGADTSWVLGAEYPQYKKDVDIKNPPPSNAMVFLDESIETLDDGYFAVKPPGTLLWQNSPTARHNRGSGFSFADGHSEVWRWIALTKEQSWDTGVKIAGQNDTTRDLIKLQNAVAVKER